MKTRTLMAALTVLLVESCVLATEPSSETDTAGKSTQAIAGNIHPAAIQIDGPASSPPGADLYPAVGTPLNAGATRDWVQDTLPNGGSGCLGSDAIATCIEAGVTGAPGGTGHWNGVRIVDGIGGNDLDIFLTGGKENDTTTWNIGPGTVGSSKYDMVQAYLANNQSQIFFGMERRGNNGTTAFDFEFNQLPPMALPSCPQNPQIPCRSPGDVLFTFEMQGSGGSGSATPFIYTWNGSAYVAGSPVGIVSSINNSTTTAGGPWGHVDSHGDWVLGALDRFTFAEATAPISLLPGINACGGTAYVQVRTRSSSTVTSDLKDTSKVFEFNFFGLTAQASLTPSCDQGFHYAVTAVGTDGNPLVDPSCDWTFSNGMTSSACSGFLSVPPGTYFGTVVVGDPLIPECAVEDDTGNVGVYAPLGVTPTLQASCQLSFDYSATVSGGADPAHFVYAWTFGGGGAVVPAASSTPAGTVAVGTGNVVYTAAIHVSEARDGLTCATDGQATVRPFAPLTIDLQLQPTALQCPNLASDAVTWTAATGGGDGNLAITWHGALCVGGSCTIDPSDSTFCAAQNLWATLSDTSGLCAPVDSETESYGKVTVVSASDLP